MHTGCWDAEDTALEGAQPPVYQVLVLLQSSPWQEEGSLLLLSFKWFLWSKQRP